MSPLCHTIYLYLEWREEKDLTFHKGISMKQNDLVIESTMIYHEDMSMKHSVKTELTTNHRQETAY